MITIQKEDYNKQYEWLFNKANTLLSLSGDEAINSLDTYFTKLGTIVERMAADRKFDESYFLLPFDEPMFNIDANTRDIIVPDVFKKGVAVQGDHASEILVFKIARYFDYKDLGNDDITIYVQYTTPDDKQNMYQVGYKDLETYPGEVRFGWILSDVATNAAGTLKFSVRFVTNNTDGTTYSLNTKTQTVTIYPALQKDTKAEIDGLASETAFYKYIRNSLEAGQTPAQTPRFDDKEAIDLPATANLNIEDTLTLVAQATKGDSGNLSYIWKYNPNEDDSGVYTTLTSGNDYEIKDDYISVEGLVAPNPREDYYDKVGETYTKHTFKPGEDVSELELFEKFNQLTIKKTNAKITGKYYVEATNTLNPNNISNVGTSSICVIPGLNDLTVTKDLDYEHGNVFEENVEIIALADENIESKTYTIAPLEIAFSTDPGAYYTVVLKKEDSENNIPLATDALVGESGEVKVSYNFGLSEENPSFDREDAEEIVGTYAFEILVKKNRDTLTKKAEFTNKRGCTRVTFAPEKPNADHVELNKVEPVTTEDGIITLNSLIPSVTGEYSSDKYNYSWKIDIIDTENNSYVDLTDNNTFGIKIIKGLGESELQLDVKNLNVAGFIIGCQVSNTLNGKTSNSVDGQKYSYLKV